MDDGMRPYEELLRDVGRQSDEETQASARTTARSAANEAVARWEAQRSRSWRVPATRAVFAFAAAAALAVVLFVVTKGRSSDALSFMVSHLDLSDNAAAGFASDETAFELNYKVQLTPFLVVRPCLHYITRPSGDPSADDVFVGMLRVEANF